MKKIKTINKTFELNVRSCDEISDAVNEFCKEAGADSKDILKYRLSAEECLLYWMSQGLEGREVVLTAGTHLMAPFFSISIDGNAGNPYLNKNEEFGSYCDSILVSLQISPEYSCKNGQSRIRYRVKKKQRGQIATLLTVIALAVVCGTLGMLMSQGVRDVLMEAVITPVYSTFFTLLGCVAGPMIFLSVAWGVYGIGDAATLGQIGKRMMLRYAGTVFVCTAAALAFFPVIGPELSASSEQGGQFSSLVEMILGVFPPNIFEPFISGNTLQIIFLAIVIGIALLYLGRQTSSIATAIEQVNVLVQFLMGIISRLVPYVIFLVIINIMWSGEAAVIAGIWKLMLAFAAMLLITAAVFILYTSVKHKVNISVLVRKIMPTFLLALTTASSAASFGTNVATCEKQYGIDKSLVSFGIPLGMVIHKPISGIFNLMLVIYFANEYDVNCSIGWLVVAVFISAVIAISLPPIPGGAAVAYSVLYAQMGIPEAALAVTLAVDMIADFFITAFSMLTLQLTLIDVAAGMGMIDKEVLRRQDSDSVQTELGLK